MKNSESDIIIWGLIGIFFLLLFIGYILPTAIVHFKLYKKAGQNKWAAFVPLWQEYVFGVISKRSMTLVWSYVVVYTLGFIPIASSIISLAIFSLWVTIFINFTKQYRSSKVFWAWYIIIPWVAVFMVNKVEYIGNDIMQQAINASGVPEPVAPTLQTTASTPVHQVVPAVSQPTVFTNLNITTPQATGPVQPVSPAPPSVNVAPAEVQASQYVDTAVSSQTQNIEVTNTLS